MQTDLDLIMLEVSRLTGVEWVREKDERFYATYMSKERSPTCIIVSHDKVSIGKWPNIEAAMVRNRRLSEIVVEMRAKHGRGWPMEWNLNDPQWIEELSQSYLQKFPKAK